jgi:uncharacterized delta-60 repeat protein
MKRSPSVLICTVVALSGTLALGLPPSAARSAWGGTGSHLVRSFGRAGHLIPPGSSSSRVAIDRHGRILVASGNRHALLVTRYGPQGRLDRGYGEGGQAEVSLERFVRRPDPEQEGGGSGVAEPSAIAVAPNGKVFVAGTIDTDLGGGTGGRSLLAALRPNGAIARGFAGPHDANPFPGQRELELTVHAIVPRAGKLLLAGQSGSKVIVDRLEADSRFDPTFGVGRRPGQVALPPPPQNRTRYFANAGFEGVLPGPHGTIYAAGFDLGALMLVKLKPDGSLDHGFAGHGILELNPSARRACACFTRGYLARDSRGRLLVAGSLEETSGVSHHKQVVVARFAPDGRLDRGFGLQGFARLGTGTTTAASGLNVDRRGRIILVGSTAVAHPATEDPPTGLAVFRLTADGSPDRSFFGDGLFSSRFHSRAAGASNVVIAPDGDLLVAGVLLRRSRAHNLTLGVLARIQSG